MRSILVTGANKGIGLELVRHFAQDNWQVFACCRTLEQEDSLHKLAEKDSHKISIYQLDVTKRDQIAKLAESLKEESIDILFNNAGIFGPGKQEFGDSEPYGWLETFHVNTIAPMLISEALVEMVARSQTRIIATMGSIMGSITENSSGNHYAYRTSKTATHMLMKGLAVDLAERGITTVSLHPGWVQTDMGGADATLTADVSAQGLKKVLLELDIEDSGCLFDYSGDKRAW